MHRNRTAFSLAVKGRLIVIGTVSTYSSSGGMQGDKVDTLRLLNKSRTVSGFFMPAYSHLYRLHMAKLVKLLMEGKLTVQLDNGGYAGIEQVAQGVEYLHSGKSKGKVVLAIAPEKPSKL